MFQARIKEKAWSFWGDKLHAVTWPAAAAVVLREELALLREELAKELATGKKRGK